MNESLRMSSLISISKNDRNTTKQTINRHKIEYYLVMSVNNMSDDKSYKDIK